MKKLVSDPNLPPAFLTELVARLGESQVDTAPEAQAAYAYDGSGREYPPAAVVFPRNSEEIAAVLRLASRYRVPVVPRGAGTGMTGGALAVRGGVVLALARLNKIIEIDTANQVAVVQPGVITGELQAAAARHGLYYPPDPASKAFCTIGGNVACCAGGPAAVKYGVTRDYVLGLEAVLADGQIIRTGVRTAKGVVGYDLTRLLVGSEGTLAVISEITLRLIPLPQSRRTFQLRCADLHRAAALVGVILARFTPCALEYLDHTALDLVRDVIVQLDRQVGAPAYPEAKEALLLVELDGDQVTVAARAEQLRALLAAESGVALQEAATPAEAEQLWAARKALSPAAFKLRPHKISDDVVVPRSLIPQLVAHIEELAAAHKLPVFTFGHAGDGNIHVNIMLDRANPREAEAAAEVRAAIQRRVLELNGTLSGEHGVGLSKAAAIAAELDPAGLELMRRIKKLFDPADILNPGKIFPPA